MHYGKAPKTPPTDDRGNITQVTNNGAVEASYTYDSFDRLVSETANGVTAKWTYDANGNILTRTSGGTTIKYTYGNSEWKDLLTNYNGQTITYDAIGNPTKWGSTTYTWDAGRRLMTLNKSGVSASFTYDINGYRTAKTVNGVTTTYYVDGGTITALKKGTDELIFIYDEKGMVIGFYHNGEPYVYVKNLQGDIIGIVDINCTMVVSYKYDAWGKLLSVTGELANTLGTLNPFRYRGYVYDDETGLYYLNSRYYDAGVGRFINSDTSAVITASQLALTDKNLFAYCDSNPVVRIDVTGMFWDVVFDVISVCVSVRDVVSDPTNGWNWGALALDVVCLVVPVVTGGGAAIKIAKQEASHADEAADIARGVNLVQTCNAVEAAGDAVSVVNKAESVTETVSTVNKGWKVGDDITNLTKAGNVPAWSTVRQRFWKNQAHYNPTAYSDLDLMRMRKGVAPIGDDGFLIELHHPFGRDGDNYFTFVTITKTLHIKIHNP